MTMDTPDDEYLVETPPFRRFVAAVNEAIEREEAPEAAIAALRGPFSELLRNDEWLPSEYAQPAQQSGMGGGIGSYLLYRKSDHSLSLSALVVPAGAQTPVHDHLAWGLVGLYRGEQFEEVFDWENRGQDGDHATLRLVDRRHLRRGDFYELIPPTGDIHRVVAADEQPSVSIHLLRNDVGCVHRHAFDVEAALVRDFRSGYVNVVCEEDTVGD